MNVPKIECIGYTVADVQDKKHKSVWFGHRGVYFCSEWERTERYCLYEIPFLKKRETKHTVFTKQNELKEFIQPFKEKQLLLYKQWLKENNLEYKSEEDESDD